jgi:hypothetical protein
VCSEREPGVTRYLFDHLARAAKKGTWHGEPREPAVLRLITSSILVAHALDYHKIFS